MSTQVRIAVVFHSGYGHTAKQAQAVASGAAGVTGATVDLVAIEDSNADAVIATVDAADAVVFGAPTYMGAASAAFKTFAEATSAPWGDGMRWKNKIAGGFTNSQNVNGNKENTLLELFVFAAQHGMHWVALGEYGGWNTTNGTPQDLNRLGSFTGAMAQSDGDASPDLAPPPSDLATAEALGRRVAEVARDYNAGRRAAATNADAA
ncbi:MAG: flavodoxin family protein [Acidimicrobiales bacterium]